MTNKGESITGIGTGTQMVQTNVELQGSPVREQCGHLLHDYRI